MTIQYIVNSGKGCMIKEFSIGFSRTINLGNFESARVEASVTYVTGTLQDFELARANAQHDLRSLLEETWKTQNKPKEKS